LFFALLPFVLHSTALICSHTLSLHDALPIFACQSLAYCLTHGDLLTVVPSISQIIVHLFCGFCQRTSALPSPLKSASLMISQSVDRKSTRLNSSHVKISYAVFCLKKKKIQIV